MIKFIYFKLFIFMTLVVYNIFPKTHMNEKQIILEIKKYEKQLDATIGVSAIFLKNNKTINYNENLLFPMASTRKLPIAAKFLLMCESKQVDINECIKLKDSDWRPGSGILHERLVFGHMPLALKDILQLMLEESDNVATDIITIKVNGAHSVTDWLKKMDIQNLILDRNSLELKANYDCIKFDNLSEIAKKNVYENEQKK